MKRRIGIYPGTFDPIHDGHVAFANEAIRACKLDEVVLLPEPSPRNKPHATIIAHRIHTLQHFVTHNRHLSVYNPTSLQFSVRDTLPELQQAFRNSELVLLVGSDVIKESFAHWPHLAMLLGHMSLAIGMRDNDSPQDIDVIIQQLQTTHQLTITYTLVYTDAPHVASTHVRNSSLSSDILEEQFGATQLSVIAQDHTHRIIKTASTRDNTILELSLVTFNIHGTEVFPTIHQAIYAGESMGKAFSSAGVAFQRSVKSVTRSVVPSPIAQYFATAGLATIVELSIFVGDEHVHYCDIVEIYSPAVSWPEKARSHSHSIDKTLHYFLSVLETSAKRT